MSEIIILYFIFLNGKRNKSINNSTYPSLIHIFFHKRIALFFISIFIDLYIFLTRKIIMLLIPQKVEVVNINH